MAQLSPADRLSTATIFYRSTIKEAIAHLERAGTGALVLRDEGFRLCGLLTDGDVRRAILRGVSFDEPCGTIGNPDPVVAPTDCSPAEALRLMDHGREFTLNHLPEIDADGRITGLLLRSDLVTQERLELSAVIMAGGFGTR